MERRLEYILNNLSWEILDIYKRKKNIFDLILRLEKKKKYDMIFYFICL